MPQKQVVQLSDGDRHQLRLLLRKGKASARCLIRARVLWATADQLTDEEIVEQWEVSPSLVYDVRRRFVRAGLAAAIQRRAQPARPAARKLDGDGEAHLLALACGAPPDGREVWTLRLLADRLVALQQADALSHETVRTVLKKTSSSRG
jgi:transposase